MSKHSKATQLVGFAFLIVLAREREGITKAEIALLERLANDDSVITEKEREMLSNLFSQIDDQEVVQAVVQGIADFRARHQL